MTLWYSSYGLRDVVERALKNATRFDIKAALAALKATRRYKIGVELIEGKIHLILEPSE